MIHGKTQLILAMALATFGTSATASSHDEAMFGFSRDGTAAQLSLEQRFDAQLDPADQRSWLKQMSSEPNQVGSPHDKANAEFMLAKFREWGWEAHIETFSVLYPTPKKVALELLGPTPYTAVLKEPAVAGDATSDLPGALPPYNVYGGDGDVTAELVYANYGMPDDYKELARRGIDVRGKIVITRYGGGWRGLKPKLAQEHGAVGCLIYSDPHDDGYAQGDVYPQGGWRPAQGVQRGSVADMQLYPGDPLTPGVGSTPDAKRLAIKDAKTILKIPVLPISYADAMPLLQSLSGPVAPVGWRGALPLTYHVGPSTAKAHLAVLSDWSQKPVYDVIAVLKGSTVPDQWIVRGNHHDGWVFGAWDPLSGNVALMAEAKAIGGLVKQGWRPQRTLVYASWDGEEPGLLGSTEWAETHAAELQKKAVLYLNSDTNGRGFLGAGGSHSLQHLVNQVAEGVTDPETHTNVRERMRAHMLVAGYAKGAKPEAKADAELAAAGGDVPIQALGSGSDYSAFLEHLALRRSISASAAKTTTAASTTRATIRSTTTRASAIPRSNMAWRCPRSPAMSCCAPPMPTCCRCVSAISAARSIATWVNCINWSTTPARPPSSSTSFWTCTRTRSMPIRPARWQRPRVTPTCPRSSWPRWTTPRNSFDRARRRIRRPTVTAPPQASTCRPRNSSN